MANDIGRQIRVDRLLMLEMLDRWIRFADRSGGRKFPEDTMDEINVCVLCRKRKCVGTTTKIGANLRPSGANEY